MPELTWTETDVYNAREAGVILHTPNTTREDIDAEFKTNPSDLHVVEYMIGDTLYCDAARSYRTSKIFNVFYDRLKEVDGKIISITQFHGRINPRLWNPN